MSFLLLRPQGKCVKSALALNNANIATVACGLIDTQLDSQAIELLPAKIAALNKALAAPIYVIVTSTVAAEQCIKLKNTWPEKIVFFAVGNSSADILRKAAFDVITPIEARTEGLLALPQLNQVSDKKIIIMKGYGGRELLVDTLKKRGALVDEWEVYERVKIAKPESTQDWQQEQIRCIIATSGEVIQAAFEHFENTWLQTRDWIVVSKRTAEIAEKMGVNHIHVSRDASDKAIIQCAQLYLTRARHSTEL
ncbi:uroporphyrinogen-III synthase [Paraglaciecola marina]|uniref:uroporphyrinogen-III synthase n=1 Tax=Paraglaciecola marina TaxID=2500157 RepID=UPI00105B74D5|nr:uroporphyrinogen-III synthase [Paraglaciecola marina]